MKLTLPLLLAIAVFPGAVASAHGAAAQEDTPCAADFVTRGLYQNRSFGFKVTIPAGMAAVWSSPPCVLDPATSDCLCMNDHGREVALAGGGSIGIYADHDAMLWTLTTAVFNDLADFKGAQPGAELSVTSLWRVKWHSMSAYRYVARRGDADEAVVREAVVATASDGRLFVVDIEAPQAQYVKYRAAFDAMLRSWRLSPVR